MKSFIIWCNTDRGLALITSHLGNIVHVPVLLESTDHQDIPDHDHIQDLGVPHIHQVVDIEEGVLEAIPGALCRTDGGIMVAGLVK